MAMARRYDDPCGTARALDIIGERWALLTVRELLLGPKRFGQLRQGLAGISPNVLSQRLRDLEDAGILQRSVLDRPASVAVYELTPRGYALEPILIELGRWGSQEPITSAGELTIDALLLAFKTTFVASTSVRATFALRVDREWYGVVVTDGGIEVTRGRPVEADTTFETDVATLRVFAFGRESLAEAEAAGRLVVSGNRSLARRFPRLFAVPAVRID
jgi:DNA-binding HxlR family transcriptional regulator